MSALAGESGRWGGLLKYRRNPRVGLVSILPVVLLIGAYAAANGGPSETTADNDRESASSADEPEVRHEEELLSTMTSLGLSFFTAAPTA
ncbi:hypothetical protein [Nodosilinea sp. P-1105]|uniref:hypothetical protein n=1 Tax=Nodosilinea sp. P-1105 TaxID=2546229 RepID=UPI00146AFAAA|nr:hypothetical protein [Nodosilinea sp. P-1105]NMF83836.1 hypothetical protein [Nodosilinea sp. P-1105]